MLAREVPIFFWLDEDMCGKCAAHRASQHLQDAGLHGNELPMAMVAGVNIMLTAETSVKISRLQVTGSSWVSM